MLFEVANSPVNLQKMETVQQKNVLHIIVFLHMLRKCTWNMCLI